MLLKFIGLSITFLLPTLVIGKTERPIMKPIRSFEIVIQHGSSYEPHTRVTRVGSDGKITREYTTFAGRERTDRKKGEISPEDIERIRKALAETDVTSLKDSYQGHAHDYGTDTISIRVDDVTKSVDFKNEPEHPPKLMTLEDLIREIENKVLGQVQLPGQK